MNIPTKFVLWISAATILFIKTGNAIKCSVCDSGAYGEQCLTRPPSATDCTGFDYCIAVARYLPTGKLASFARSCSPVSLPDSCMPGVDKVTGEKRLLCYTTCTKDGCNSFTTLHHMLDLLRRKRRVIGGGSLAGGLITG